MDSAVTFSFRVWVIGDKEGSQLSLRCIEALQKVHYRIVAFLFLSCKKLTRHVQADTITNQPEPDQEIDLG